VSNLQPSLILRALLLIAFASLDEIAHAQLTASITTTNNWTASFQQAGSNLPTTCYGLPFKVQISSGGQTTTIVCTITNVKPQQPEITSARIQVRTSPTGAWQNLPPSNQPLTTIFSVNTPPSSGMRLLTAGPNNFDFRIEFTRATNLSPQPSNRRLATYKVDAFYTAGSNPHTFAAPHNGTIDLGTGGTGGRGGSQQGFAQQQRGTPISWKGPAVITLRRQFNPRTGRMETSSNGVFNRLGYLNLKGNRTSRQALRNYRRY
jgi:hypothetical protein